MWTNFEIHKRLRVSLSLVIIFLATLCFLDPKLACAFSLPLMLISLWPNRRWIFISLLTPLIWVFSDIIGWSRLDQRLGSLTKNRFTTTYEDRIYFLTGALLVAYLIFEISCRQKIMKQKHLFGSLILASIIFFGSYFRSANPLWIYALGVCFLLSKFALYLILIIYDSAKKKREIPWAFLFPFWHFHPSILLAYPHGLDVLKKGEATDDQSFLKSQISGLKLLFWILLIDASSHFLCSILIKPTQFYEWNFNFFSLSRLPDFVYWRVPPANELKEVSHIEIILGFLLSTAHTWISFASRVSIPVCIARMAGFHLFRAVHKPFEAKSINSLWSNFEFYYVSFLKKIFILPMLGKKFFGNKSYNRNAALIIGIVGGGQIYHVFRDLPLLYADKSPEWLVKQVLINDTIYFLTIGVTSIVFGNFLFEIKSLSPFWRTFTRKMIVLFALLGFYLVVYMKRKSIAGLITVLKLLIFGPRYQELP